MNIPDLHFIFYAMYLIRSHFIRTFHGSSRLFSTNKKFLPPDEDEDYLNLVNKFEIYGPWRNCGSRTKGVFLIQPRVKATEYRFSHEKAELMAQETKALIESIPGWKVADYTIESIPWKSEDRYKYIFGQGKMMDLTFKVQEQGYDCIVINVPKLEVKQYKAMSELWRLPVFDRYGLVLQIFKSQAKSMEAKLQVSLAEIPYLKARIPPIDSGSTMPPNIYMEAHDNSMATLRASHDKYRAILANRTVRITEKLSEIQEARRKQRHKLVNSNRGSCKITPVIGIIGYTNSGKTSLIRYLTKNTSASPEDRLFATLDVSHYSGRLINSGQPVLFSDTVGFLSDLPQGLIASFQATLDEIRHCDLLLHVQDIHNVQFESQKTKVMQTLDRLNLPPKLLRSHINCCNKVDLVHKFQCPPNSFPISCANGDGIAELQKAIELRILENTGLSVRTFKIDVTKEYLNFLYEESHVIQLVPVENDTKFMFVTVIISPQSLKRYESRFGELRKRMIY